MNTGAIIEGKVSLIEMTATCARDLTDRINATATDLAGMLQRARDGMAWKALGYESWSAYCAAEINVGQRRVFQLLDFAEIREQVNPGSVAVLTEKSARQLKKIAPAKRAEVFDAAVERAGGSQPTAKVVEAVVTEVADSALPSAVIKYTPALGGQIADNAIRILETITAGDTERGNGLFKVAAYAATTLAGFTNPELRQKYSAVLAVIIQNWKTAELATAKKGRRK